MTVSVPPPNPEGMTEVELTRSDSKDASTTQGEKSQGMTEGGEAIRKDSTLRKPEEFQRDKCVSALKDAQDKLTLSPTAVSTLQKLIDLHVSQLRVESDYRAEWLALKAKYYRLLDKFYMQRSGLLVTEDAVAAAAETAAPNAETPVAAKVSANVEAAASIPDFWLTVLLHNQAVSSMIEARDEELLKYVTDITYSWANPDEQMDFTIVFKFAENPFFQNSELTKTFKLEIEGETQDPILLRSIGTTIQWKDGRDITTKTVTKRQKNKRTGETRVVKEHVDKLSFFHFFDSHEVPDEDELESMDDDEIDALESLLDTEYEVGCILRDKIINHAVGWYLGVELDEDEDTSGDSDLETDDEEESEDEGDLPKESRGLDSPSSSSASSSHQALKGKHQVKESRS
eukprot:Gregarina_sp_Pseudo_9__5234@NODE_589_length_2542_cov_104_537755_g555_i0_p1_GENE_NODE_589_length_2542_cov_104_537755_g555_i0NODE_589_length_2542_cov_104_537755_g555_i0_p1_ORF_typecomplete_len401_score120_69NAP/PF00956_18/3_1e54RPC/PF03428_13/0_036_NODE_589_length_2542_cov_104_537755_g555_i012672469